MLIQPCWNLKSKYFDEIYDESIQPCWYILALWSGYWINVNPVSGLFLIIVIWSPLDVKYPFWTSPDLFFIGIKLVVTKAFQLKVGCSPVFPNSKLFGTFKFKEIPPCGIVSDVFIASEKT